MVEIKIRDRELNKEFLEIYKNTVGKMYPVHDNDKKYLGKIGIWEENARWSSLPKVRKFFKDIFSEKKLLIGDSYFWYPRWNENCINANVLISYNPFNTYLTFKLYNFDFDNELSEEEKKKVISNILLYIKNSYNNYQGNKIRERKEKSDREFDVFKNELLK